MKSSDCFRPFSFCVCTCNFSVVSLWGAEFHSKEARQWTVRVDPSSPPTLHLPPIRHHPVHQHSWLWFIYRWNYLVLRFDASHCQSNFILHSKPFCTAPRRDKNLRFGFHFLFVLLFSFFFVFFFFAFGEPTRSHFVLLTFQLTSTWVKIDFAGIQGSWQPGGGKAPAPPAARRSFSA